MTGSLSPCSRIRRTGLRFAAFLVPILLLAPGPICRAGTTGPLLRISERKIDFGTVPQFQQLHHPLVLGNDGDAPLRILKIDTTCGCTAAIPSDSIVPPGKEVKIDVTFNTREYEGEQTKTLTLHTNDPAEPVVRIDVVADVKPYVRMDPTVIRFDPVHRGATPTMKVRFSADPGFGLTIGEIVGGEDRLAVKKEPERTSKEEAVNLYFTIRPDAPPGQFRAIIKIKTLGKIARTFDLLAMGDVISYFVLGTDARVQMPTAKDGQGATSRVAITCDGTKPYKLTEVTSNLPFLTGNLAQNGKGYDLVISVDPQAPGGDYMAKLEVKTTDPAQPVIQLVVKGYVRK